MRKREFLHERFGRLVVIGEVPKEERKGDKRILICQCDCGNIAKVSASNLTTGNSQSCGCLAVELMRQARERRVIGERFGRLLVQSTYYDEKNKRRAKCLCDCGNYADVGVGDLFSGMTKSCGCLRSEVSSQLNSEDVTGKTFYELTAIKRVENQLHPNGSSSSRWLFKCSCGKDFIATLANVKSGKTKSCGHIGKSYPEYQIFNFLTEHHIKFNYNTTLPNLINPDTNHHLYMDFIIYKPNNTFFVLEHQGEQHFYTGERNNLPIGKTQREVTDKLKKEYCKQYNIQLYETRYDEDYLLHLKQILQEQGLYGGEDDGDYCG